MTTPRTEQYIITDLRNDITVPSFRHDVISAGSGVALPGGKTPVLWVDGSSVPGGFYSEYAWHYPGQDGSIRLAGPDPHTHPFDEVIGFVGINQADHFDLGGEVEVVLEDYAFTMARSFLVYIPAGMRHCPVRVKTARAPIFQYVLGSAPYYEGSSANAISPKSRDDLAGLFVSDYKKNLIHPEYRGAPHEEPGVHLHITYLDKEVVPNSKLYVEASWFGTKPRPKPEPGKEPTGPQAHVHPFPEIINFFGTNPDDVHDLGGELELWIDGEQHIITRSCVAFVPGGVVHCPIMLRNIKRPIFHFTAGTGSMYV
jgi:hypothetical protein